ncbi:MAG: hypothetical protein AAF478_12590 [Pseudomonadota bacterium]
MASKEQRNNLKFALQVAAKENNIYLSSSTLDFFVDRAIRHIESRYFAESNRITEYQNAEKSAFKLIDNITVFTRERNINIDTAERYVKQASGCFYPWCKPE